jgi:hypothetical protein
VDIPVYNFSTHLRETDRTVRIECVRVARIARAACAHEDA